MLETRGRSRATQDGDQDLAQHGGRPGRHALRPPRQADHDHHGLRLVDRRHRHGGPADRRRSRRLRDHRRHGGRVGRSRRPPDFTPATFYSGNAYGMTSPEPDINRASMPFDANRPASSRARVRRSCSSTRGPRPGPRRTHLRTVRGYGNTADGYHPSSPEPSGRWEEQAMRLALEEAELDAAGGRRHRRPRHGHAEGRHRRDPRHQQPVRRTRVAGHVAEGDDRPHRRVAGAWASSPASTPCTRAGSRRRSAPPSRTPRSTSTWSWTRQPTSSGRLQVNAFGFGGQDASLVVTRD